MRHETHSHYNTLQHAATHCNTLQYTATHCNTLQHATRDMTHTIEGMVEREVSEGMPRVLPSMRAKIVAIDACIHVVVCCSVLQCVAGCCRVLPRVAVCHSVLRCVLL